MLRRWLATVLVAGCGRVAFDDVTGSQDAGTEPIDAPGDAPMTAQLEIDRTGGFSVGMHAGTNWELPIVDCRPCRVLAVLWLASTATVTTMTANGAPMARMGRQVAGASATLEVWATTIAEPGPAVVLAAQYSASVSGALLLAVGVRGAGTGPEIPHVLDVAAPGSEPVPSAPGSLLLEFAVASCIEFAQPLPPQTVIGNSGGLGTGCTRSPLIHSASYQPGGPGAVTGWTLSNSGTGTVKLIATELPPPPK